MKHMSISFYFISISCFLLSIVVIVLLYKARKHLYENKTLEIELNKLQYQNKSLATANANISELYIKLEDSKKEIKENEDALKKTHNQVLEANKALAKSSVNMSELYVEIEKQKDTVKKANKLYYSLLNSTFPKPIVKELTTTGKVKPKRYPNVGVLFADVVSFTTYAEIHSPEVVLRNLQELVNSCELICIEHNVQKIKTIGDAFLATIGMFEQGCSVFDLILCAIGFMNACKELSSGWKLRIGIAHGSVVAGIIGNRQYLYDIWGNTVNLAARVQSKAQAMEILITEAIYDVIKKTLRTEAMGPIVLKGQSKKHKLYKIIY